MEPLSPNKWFLSSASKAEQILKVIFFAVSVRKNQSKFLKKILELLSTDMTKKMTFTPDLEIEVLACGLVITARFNFKVQISFGSQWRFCATAT